MPHRLIVLGAGYSGTIAAGRLARRLHPDDVTITVVSAEPDFVERVRMHQLAVGQDLKAHPLDTIFAGTGVDVRQARVTGIDVDRHTVAVTDTDGEQELVYDTLVYGLGSVWNTHDVPGVAEYAHDIAGRTGALRLRERLGELSGGQTVTVVGGGLTGLEAATEIAETRPDLTVSVVVRGSLGSWLSTRGRAHLRTVLTRLGITVHEDLTVTEVAADHVVTDDGRSLPSEVTVWTAGFAVHPIVEQTSLETAETGQIVVDSTMRSVSHPDVYAIGDAAFAIGAGDKPLRMSCASGTPMAWQAAGAIVGQLTGRRIPRAPLRYVQQCISLGRRDGLIQFVTADDRSKSGVLTGKVAARYKELICASAAWSVVNPFFALPVRRHRILASEVTEEAAHSGPACKDGGHPQPAR